MSWCCRYRKKPTSWDRLPPGNFPAKRDVLTDAGFVFLRCGAVRPRAAMERGRGAFDTRLRHFASCARRSSAGGVWRGPGGGLSSFWSAQPSEAKKWGCPYGLPLSFQQFLRKDFLLLAFY